MRHRVFAYGTLMFPDIAAAVTGERAEHEHARLPDHARHALHGRVHPGAVPGAGHAVEGILYHDLTPAALRRLDELEGALFRRHRVTVAGTGARPCSALVYLLRPRWQSLLLTRDWCPHAFRRDRHTPARCHAGLPGGRPR